MSSAAARRIKSRSKHLAGIFTETVGSTADYSNAFQRYMKRTDVADLTDEEVAAWAEDCRITCKEATRVTDNRPAIDRAHAALKAMGHAGDDRLVAEIRYGAALNEIRARLPNDRAFGERLIAEGLDHYELSQLGTVQRVEIKRDTRVACMWLAANREIAEKMLADGTRAKTARGLKAAFDRARPAPVAPVAPTSTPAPTPPTPPTPASYSPSTTTKVTPVKMVYKEPKVTKVTPPPVRVVTGGEASVARALEPLYARYSREEIAEAVAAFMATKAD